MQKQIKYSNINAEALKGTEIEYQKDPNCIKMRRKSCYCQKCGELTSFQINTQSINHTILGVPTKKHMLLFVNEVIKPRFDKSKKQHQISWNIEKRRKQHRQDLHSHSSDSNTSSKESHIQSNNYKQSTLKKNEEKNTLVDIILKQMEPTNKTQKKIKKNVKKVPSVYQNYLPKHNTTTQKYCDEKSYILKKELHINNMKQSLDKFNTNKAGYFVDEIIDDENHYKQYDDNSLMSEQQLLKNKQQHAGQFLRKQQSIWGSFNKQSDFKGQNSKELEIFDKIYKSHNNSNVSIDSDDSQEIEEKSNNFKKRQSSLQIHVNYQQKQLKNIQQGNIETKSNNQDKQYSINGHNNDNNIKNVKNSNFFKQKSEKQQIIRKSSQSIKEKQKEHQFQRKGSNIDETVNKLLSMDFLNNNCPDANQAIKKEILSQQQDYSMIQSKKFQKQISVVNKGLNLISQKQKVKSQQYQQKGHHFYFNPINLQKQENEQPIKQIQQNLDIDNNQYKDVFENHKKKQFFLTNIQKGDQNLKKNAQKSLNNFYKQQLQSNNNNNNKTYQNTTNTMSIISPRNTFQSSTTTYQSPRQKKLNLKTKNIQNIPMSLNVSPNNSNIVSPVKSINNSKQHFFNNSDIQSLPTLKKQQIDIFNHYQPYIGYFKDVIENQQKYQQYQAQNQELQRQNTQISQSQNNQNFQNQQKFSKTSKEFYSYQNK